jgi:hypothetical protein
LPAVAERERLSIGDSLRLTREDLLISDSIWPRLLVP